MRRAVPFVAALTLVAARAVACDDPEAAAWRAAHRLVDVHVHVEATEERYARAARILDAAGIGFALNLSGGTVTRGGGGDGRSEFERHRELVERLHPGRFGLAMNFDWSDYDAPDFAQRAAQQVADGAAQGALALKEFKRLGLFLKDGAGKLIPVDTPKLDLAWEKCGELGLPVFIHVADPKAFWQPYDEKNERWSELQSHRDWWFGDPARFPARDELFEQLLRVVGRHAKTTFVAVHFADDPEELEKVDGWLDAHPNLCVDVAARIPEIGRRDPAFVRALFLKHQDRILLGTDFQVYGKLILGSSGDDENPDDAAAASFFSKHWTFFETLERGFPHMTPIQGSWTIDAIGLPAPALRKIYFDNARRVLARGWPPPELHARRVPKVSMNGMLKDPAWDGAPAQLVELQADRAVARPELATTVKALWNDEFLWIGFSCPCTQVVTLAGADLSKERLGLWEGDVVELFAGRDAEHPGRYLEFELAPNGEKLDVAVADGKKDFGWSSGFKTAVCVDLPKHVWTAEMMIPWTAFGGAPKAGERWRANVFRCDRTGQAQLALRPTLSNTFHQPDRFATLVFDPE
jgi:predicted TIM-barrel fold metal-dependent hydrolase